MKVRLVFPDKARAKRARKEIEEIVTKILKEEFMGFYVYEVILDPGDYREVDEIIGKHTSGRGSMETIDTYVSVGNESEEN